MFDISEDKILKLMKIPLHMFCYNNNIIIIINHNDDDILQNDDFIRNVKIVSSYVKCKCFLIILQYLRHKELLFYCYYYFYYV